MVIGKTFIYLFILTGSLHSESDNWQQVIVTGGLQTAENYNKYPAQKY
jgi:hypothetical protein